MRQLAISVAVAMLVYGLAVAGQTPAAPKPTGEHQKLQVLTGNWSYQGDVPASPFGPAGKVTGSEQTRSIVGGFAIQRQTKDNGPLGEREMTQIISYDATKKVYTFTWFDSAGNTGAGTATLSGNTFAFQGTAMISGKPVGDRCNATVAANRNSIDVKCDGAADGKTWVPSFTGKWTKTGS